MFGIADLLDYILPSSDRSKHDILRLEYLCASKLLKNETNIMNIIEHIPASMFESLLQTVIFNCYMEFINIDFSVKYKIYEDGSSLPRDFHIHLYDREVAFPDALWILILNWPHKQIVLRNLIPPLHPPFEMFQDTNGPLASIKQAVGDVDDMLLVFRKFCTRLIYFIMNAVFKCTSSSATGDTCSLRMLDVSGLGSVHLTGYSGCFTCEEDILKGIRNSTIHTFGHKIDIYADTLIVDGNFEFYKTLIKENLNPNVGLSIYFNGIDITLYNYTYTPMPTDFYNVLALLRCKYMQLSTYKIDRRIINNVSTYLPGLIGIGLKSSAGIMTQDFLSAFGDLEQVNLECGAHGDLIIDLSKMIKGLTYLNLSECALLGNNLQCMPCIVDYCMATGILSNRIIELDISGNQIRNEYEAIGITTLCQKLNSVKVLIMNNCYLGTLPTKTVSKLIDTFKEFDGLEFLSMKNNTFTLETTNKIIDVLAQNKSLRYLSLEIPRVSIEERWNREEDFDDIFEPNNEEMEYLHNLSNTFHEKLNRFRQSPIYISWVLGA